MEHLRRRVAPILVVLLAFLSGCMADNLAKWADTRVDSPAEQNLRHGVAVLFVIPALAADVVFFPVQVIAGYHPYGDRCAPDSEAVRYRLEDQPDAR